MDKDFLQSHLRGRRLLSEMFIGKWKDAIPQELRHEVGLVLFGHEVPVAESGESSAPFPRDLR